MIPQKLKTNATIFKVLGWIAIIGSILGAVIAIAMVAISGDSESMVGTLIVMIPVAIVSIIIGLVHFAVAKGIHNRKAWSKTVGFIFAILMLFSIPVGTILGIIILLGFSDEQSKAWFSGAGNMDAQNYQPPVY